MGAWFGVPRLVMMLSECSPSLWRLAAVHIGGGGISIWKQQWLYWKRLLVWELVGLLYLETLRKKGQV